MHCGRVKVIFEVPNEWEFSKEKITEIKEYAISNNVKYLIASRYTDYHHCTDTHKHIVYKLLDDPEDLDLANDQSQGRDTPKDYEKAGESTTHGVRNTLIGKTYAEPSKTFTVVDVENNEVLSSNGMPGNTDRPLSGFKESPVAYMKSKCPDNGYYVFIGAYNDDYHSFTIVVEREGEAFGFQFIDQIIGVKSYTESTLENSKLLDNVDRYRFDYPMKLELFQLRNKKK